MSKVFSIREFTDLQEIILLLSQNFKIKEYAINTHRTHWYCCKKS